MTITTNPFARRGDYVRVTPDQLRVGQRFDYNVYDGGLPNEDITRIITRIDGFEVRYKDKAGSLDVTANLENSEDIWVHIDDLDIDNETTTETIVNGVGETIHTVVTNDPVNLPAHYTSDPSGVECITVTRHRNFNIGNAIKYLWRAGLKDDPAQSAKAKTIEDLRKAVFYINDEIARIEAL